MSDRPKGFIVQTELMTELVEIGFSPEDIGTLILAMSAYISGGDLPEMDKAVKAVFVTRIRGLLDKDIDKYRKTVERNRENGQYGKLGGRPKKTQEGLTQTQTKPTETQTGFFEEAKVENAEEKTLKHKTQNTKHNTNSNELVVVGKARPTSPDQVREYRISLGYQQFDAERFFYYYERNGWVQGKNKPIKDWKRCVRNWQRNEKQYKNDKPESWVDFAMRMGGDG